MSRSPNQSRARHGAALLIGLLSRLPLPVLYGLSDLLFVLLFHLFRFQRRLAVDNLARAFPGLEAAHLNRLAARSYRNALDFLVETIKAWRLDRHRLAQRVVLENAGLFSELLHKHKVVVALTSHCGNWEWLHLACAAGLDGRIAAVYNPLNHPGIDALLLEMRSRFGSTLVEAGEALAPLIAFARDGGVIALNADQGPRPEDDKYWSRLLGVETAFFTGPEKLARLFNAPVVYVAMQRTGRGRFRVRFRQLSEPPYGQTPGEIMQPYIEALEQQILAAPQDWFWLYKRWKYGKPVYET